ncbi:sigma-70 family RNA polymerase sigma factor [Methylocella sp.]|uniref:sigma-70 family RNA polymerase sigma factor n=1 Tax=Methylocella sp. TaxID=1978226 RepID=UPI003784AE74
MTKSAREAEWARWMRAAMGGDAVAYRQFLTSVAPHVRAVARSRCRSFGASESDAEDVVQEALLAIHLKRGTWDETRPIGPWVSAIARNKLIDVLRRRGRHASVPIDDVVETLAAEEPTTEISGRDIGKLLARLKTRQREIVQSISINGDSIRETAGRLQMTETAVRVALHRALKALGALYRGGACEN